MRISVLCLILLCGCIPGERVSGGDGLRAMHDAKHAVTCWTAIGAHGPVGVSCLPDSVLKDGGM